MIQALQQQVLPAVILFTGPQGVGKESAAVWLAQFDRCREIQRPCGACPECRRIADSVHPDVIVFNSNDDARVSIEQVRTALSQYRHRATIVDRSRWLIISRAERLTGAAVSALLKFLEEPPPHIHVILSVSSLRQVPATLSSRAAVYRWHLVPHTVLDQTQATPAARARSAGRPEWLKIDRVAESTRTTPLLACLTGEPALRFWPKIEPEQASELLATLELLVRDIMLEASQAEGRLLWPEYRTKYRDILKHRQTNWPEWIDRLQDGLQAQRHNVSPRLILHNLLSAHA